MDARERKVLTALRFDAVPTEKTLWRGFLPHVNGLNQAAYDRVRHELTALQSDSVVDSPAGLVVHGEFGSGKSHLIWWARRLIAGFGGYYFNIHPDGRSETLWRRVVSSIVSDLHEPVELHQFPIPPTTQLTLVVQRLARRVELPETAQAILSGREAASDDVIRAQLREFADRLRDVHPSRDLRNVGLALALAAVRQDDAQAAAWAFFHDNEDELDTRGDWGLRPIRPGAPDEIVRHLSTLLAMTGPSLFVVDQIDDLVAGSAASTRVASSDTAGADLATGLMTIREKLTRSITLISCLDHTWRVIKEGATRSAIDRFHEAMSLKPIPSPDVGRRLIATFLARQFDELDFVAPYPTWPVPPDAFESVKGFRPRRLIQLVEAYVRRCLEADELVPIEQLSEPVGKSTEPEASDPVVTRTHDRFADHRRSVILDELKQTSAEKDVAAVLTAAVRALAIERGVEWEVRDNCRGAGSPSIHCEVKTPDGAKLYLRGINTKHAATVGSRLDKARAVAYDGQTDSHLIIVRTNPWGQTPRVREASIDVENAGGIIVDLNDNDLRTLRAVHLTTVGDAPGVREWLRQHRPVGSTALATAVDRFAEPPDDALPAMPVPGPSPAWGRTAAPTPPSVTRIR